MTFGAYLRSAAAGLVIHLLLAGLVSAYLILLGAGWPDLVTLWFIWLVAVGAYHTWRFATLRAYYHDLLGSLHELEAKHLLGSLGSEPPLAELAPLWEALVEVSRSVTDEVERVEQQAREHREYVESWIHEIKAPIAAVRLIADPLDAPLRADLIDELDRIEFLVEQALFYARSSAVGQDYFVRETVLDEPVKAVLRRHARQFIANHVAVTLEDLDLTVFTDRKWLEFILTQILINAVKYRRDRDAAVRIWAERHDDGVVLAIEDNGIGIPQADLSRVFDKGFTGANGRRDERSTGVGLFLARKLCLALGHVIAIESNEGRYTRVTLVFPKGRLLRPMSEPGQIDTWQPASVPRPEESRP